MRNFQKAADRLTQVARERRSRSQMTLLGLIKRLAFLNANFPDLKVALHSPHSYRGYYSDLALEAEFVRPVRESLLDVTQALNATFTGYKGGDFYMDADTPLWLSAPGFASGLRITGIENNGTVITSPEPNLTREHYEDVLREAKERYGENLDG